MTTPTLFQISSNDQSINYLGEIFGVMGPFFSQGANNQSQILGAISQVFNSIVLTIAILVVIYTTVVGLLKAAHEGEFMGRQGNSMWTPLKMVLGIASLVPVASGYSVIQLVMMYVIIQGGGR